MRVAALHPAIRPILAIPVALAAAGFLSGCNDKSVAAAKPPRPVLVAPVHYEQETPERSFVATVRPRIESDLGFRVAGKVAKRLVEVGDTVSKGQPLATLDDTDFRLQAEQAEAERRAATGALTQAAAAERRAQDLRSRGWSTDAAIDQARAAADEARGRLARAERAVELTKNSFSYATLVADAPGVVTASLIEPGQVVAAGQAALRIARTGEKEAVVAVPESMVERARTGSASVVLWSKPGKTYSAKLRELSPAADAATRTYLAKFSLPDVGDDAQLGMTATVLLADAGKSRVAPIPLSALFNEGKGPAVFVVNPQTGTLTLKPVEVKAYESRDALITGGVEEGDKIVALGVQKLDAAQKVRIVDALSF